MIKKDQAVNVYNVRTKGKEHRDWQEKKCFKILVNVLKFSKIKHEQTEEFTTTNTYSILLISEAMR